MINYSDQFLKQSDNSIQIYLVEETDLNIQIAKENGLFVKEAHDNVLLLDIDTDEGYDMFSKNIEMFIDFIDINNIREFKSKSGNKHIVVPLLVEMSQPVRMLLQASLGSDIKREICNLRRYLYTEDSKILLFMTEDVKI